MDRFYIGHTGESMDELLRKHLANYSGFTSKAKDWLVKYTEELGSKGGAYTREMEIKNKKSRKYIQNLSDSVG